ncbi:alpha/beta hydrolase [Streptomyces sp. NPDC091292]|uniref:alpha/beta hydrolase n=1 Tax=Streptomyces sp. NPDC091292 TaxID=3365991 RepID=UPI0037F310D1
MTHADTDTDTAPVPHASAPVGRPRGHTWQPPAGIAPRGTLVVLPGRGEHALVYERFGRRLAADGYVVHALDTTPDDRPDALRAAVTTALGGAAVAPVVLVGSDTGALQALHLAAAGDPSRRPDGVIAAGTALPPTPGARVRRAPSPERTWDGELDARTACPTHRARLTDDPDFVRGRLDTPVPPHLRPDVRPDVPVLVLHGAADPLTPAAPVRDLAARLPRAAFGLLHDGRHDVLNDATHRSTAATVVLWLERLRADPDLRPVLTVETDPFA